MVRWNRAGDAGGETEDPNSEGGGDRSFTSTPFRWWAKEEHRIIEQPAVVDGISVRRMLKGGRGREEGKKCPHLPPPLRSKTRKSETSPLTMLIR
jgi:hypothetical protein